jgi:vancomycin permeability regulator SanA
MTSLIFWIIFGLAICSTIGYFAIKINRFLIFIPVLFLILIPTIIVNINPFSNLPQRTPQVALIFGAGILNNEIPSVTLKNRLDIGLNLYNNKKIKAIIVSGDNSASNYNEPAVMRNYLISNSVPANRIFEDYGGVRTADSCYRVKNYFNVSEVYLITQEFHIPRAKFLCDALGLESIALPAQSSRLYTQVWGYFREIFANWAAIKDSISFQPKIKSDGKEADFSKILQE